MNLAVWERTSRVLQEKEKQKDKKKKNKNLEEEEEEAAAEEKQEQTTDAAEEDLEEPSDSVIGEVEGPDDAVLEGPDDAALEDSNEASETIDTESPPEDSPVDESSDADTTPEQEDSSGRSADTTEVVDNSPESGEKENSSSDVAEENDVFVIGSPVEYPVEVSRDADGKAVAYSCRGAMPPLKDERLQQDATLIPTKVDVEYDFDVLHKHTLTTSTFYESLQTVEERILTDVAASLGLTADCVEFVVPELGDEEGWNNFDRSTRIVTVRSQPEDIVDTAADCIVDTKNLELASYVGVEASTLDCTSVVGLMTLKYAFGSDETGIKNRVLSRIKEGMERNKYISAEFPHLAYVGTRPETGGKDEVLTIDPDREDPGALLSEETKNPDAEDGSRWTGIGISLLFFLLLCFMVLSFVLVRRVRSGRRMLDGKPRSPRQSRAAAETTAEGEGDDEAVAEADGYHTDGEEGAEDAEGIRPEDDITDYDPIRAPICSTDETPPRSNTSASIAAGASPDAFNEEGSNNEDDDVKKFTRTARVKRAMAGAVSGAMTGATAAMAVAATRVSNLRNSRGKEENVESAPESSTSPRSSTFRGGEVGGDAVSEDAVMDAALPDAAADKTRGAGVSGFFASMMQPLRSMRKGKKNDNADGADNVDEAEDDKAEEKNQEDVVNDVETPSKDIQDDDIHDGITPKRSGIRSEVYDSPDAVEVGLNTSGDVEDLPSWKDAKKSRKKEATGADVILSELEAEEALGRSRYVLGRETSDLSKQQRRGRDIMKDRLKVSATASTEDTDEVELNYSPSGF